MTDTIANSQCRPVMIYARAANGNLYAITTDGQGNLNTSGSTSTVDTISNTVPNPVMIYGRAPNGVLTAVTTDGNGNLS